MLRKAGLNASWGGGKLSGPKPIKYSNKGVKPGDIGYYGPPLHHHDIVERVSGKWVYTIDGNQECSGILRKKRALSSLKGYYAVD